MDSIFLHYVDQLSWAIYVVAFLCLLIEGEGVLFVCAYLTNGGYLNPIILIPVVVVAVFTGDVLWFKLGGWLEARFPGIRSWADRIAAPLDRFLLSRLLHTLLFIKFAYGLGRATLLRIGTLKIPTKDFIKADFCAASVWIIVIGGLGYAFSASMALLKHYMKYAEVGILIGLCVLFTVTHLVAKYGIREMKK